MATSSEIALRTELAKFRVVGEGHRCVWLEVLYGDDAGIRVSIPLWNDAYSERLQERIQSLERDEVVEAVLVSETDPPNWRVEELSTSV